MPEQLDVMVEELLRRLNDVEHKHSPVIDRCVRAPRWAFLSPSSLGSRGLRQLTVASTAE